MKASLVPSVALLGAGWLALVAACSSDTSSRAAVDPSPAPDANAFAERDFVRDLSLRASFGASVVLDLEPPASAVDATANDSGTAGVDVVPYHATHAESLHLCLDPSADVVSELSLVDAAGKAALRLAEPGACGDALVTEGDYELRLTHRPGASQESSAMFVHEVPRGAIAAPQCAPSEYVPSPLAGASGDLWQLQTRARQEVRGKPGLTLYPGANRFDPAEGFHLSRGADGDVTVAAESGWVVAPSGQQLGLFDPNGKAANGRTAWQWAPVADGAKWTFTVNLRRQPAYFWSSPPSSTYFSYLSVPGWERLRVTLTMRFVPDGDALKTLKAGEVALYEGPQYSGRAWVLNDANAFPSALSDIVGFVQPKSIRVGCDTTLLAYAGANRSGEAVRIGGDDPALQLAQPIASAQIIGTRAITIEKNACTGCNLRRVNLAGLTMRGLAIRGGSLEEANFEGTILDAATFENVRLAGASFAAASLPRASVKGTLGDRRLDASRAAFDRARLEGATLERVTLAGGSFAGAKLDGAQLTDVDFDQATIGDASFVGAMLKGILFTRTDLTRATLAAAGAAPDFRLLDGETISAAPCDEPLSRTLRLNDLTSTRVRFQQLPTALWNLLDLGDVRFDFDGLAASARTLVRKNLCGLRLRGVSLNHFDLTESTFARSDLTRADLTNAQLSFVSFKHAQLDQATFQYSDLSNAVLDDAVSDSGVGSVTFSGSLFAPKSLLRAHFTKVQMLRATVKMPPAAFHEGALFDDGNFTETDFTGSDLTGLSMTGGSFVNAVFVNTKLAGAKLGRGARASVFSQAVFCGAKIQGASFVGAALTDGFFPVVATTLPNQDGPGDAGAPSACAAVDLGTATTLDDAVISTDATCPDSVTPAPGQGCVGVHWTPLAPSTRPVCPPPKDGGIGPGKVKACYACTSNCACASQRCAAGICAGCADAGY